MEPKELSKMRLKEIAVTNGLSLTMMITLFIIGHVFTIPSAYLLLGLAVLVLIQGVFGFIRGDSTKSIIPLYQQVAIYEKEKMGSEWSKRRKRGYVWNLILSCFLFWQFYSKRHSSVNVFQTEIIFMSITAIILLVIININLIMHFRKVERFTSVDMK